MQRIKTRNQRQVKRASAGFFQSVTAGRVRSTYAQGPPIETAGLESFRTNLFTNKKECPLDAHTLNDGARPVNGAKFANAKRLSADALKAALRGRESDVLRYLGVDWPKNGASHIQCPFPGHDDKTPSWRWMDDSSRWVCTCATDKGRNTGDIFDAARILKGWSLPEAIAHLTSAFLGERLSYSCKEKIREAPPPLPQAPSDDARARRIRKIALALWNSAGPIEGPAEAYLTGARGVTPPPGGWPAALRYVRKLYHKDPVARVISFHPGIVMTMTKAPGGEAEALGRVWLTEDGSAKASVKPNKAALAPIHGLACWFGTPGPRLIVVEGLEDALSVLMAGAAFVCAGFTGDNVANIELPPGVREAVFFGDRQKGGEGLDGAGRRAIARARPRWERSGAAVCAVAAHSPHKDASDVLRAEGAAAVRGVIG
jgi:putative DNA primase/helicase